MNDENGNKRNVGKCVKFQSKGSPNGVSQRGEEDVKRNVISARKNTSIGNTTNTKNMNANTNTNANISGQGKVCKSKKYAITTICVRVAVGSDYLQLC